MAPVVASNSSKFFASIGLNSSLLNSKYILRLVLSVLLLAIFGAINSTAAEYAGWRNPRVQFLDQLDGHLLVKEHSLPDIGHDLVSFFALRLTNGEYDFIDWYYLPDICVSYSTTLLFILFAVHPLRFQLLRRFALVFGVLNLFRSTMVNLTALPDPSPVCLKQFTSETGDYKKHNFFPLGLSRMVLRTFISPGALPTCGDMIFSGHTCLLFCVLMIYEYYCRVPRSYPVSSNRYFSSMLQIVRILVSIYTWIAAVTIIGTKFHYTLDVFLAIVFTYLGWKFYFFYIKEIKTLRKSNNYIIRCFCWIENEETHKIEDSICESFNEATSSFGLQGGNLITSCSRRATNISSVTINNNNINVECLISNRSNNKDIKNINQHDKNN